MEKGKRKSRREGRAERRTSIHRRDPITAPRGSFCLLRFRPEPYTPLYTPSQEGRDQPGPRCLHSLNRIDAVLNADNGST